MTTPLELWGPRGGELLQELAAAARRQGWRAATRTALRMRSFATRHVVAYNATNGTLDYAGVVALAREVGGGASWSPPPIAGWDGKWTEGLAWVVGLQQLEPDDDLVGARLFAMKHAEFGLGSLTERGRFIYLQLLLRAGERERARDVVDELGESADRLLPYARADVLNPFERDVHVPTVAAAQWLGELNAILVAAGTEPVGLVDDGPTPFDRLRGDAPGGSVGGPLVSVVMSAYRPDHTLLTSVRSILDQTWADLELLVVDDASGPEFDEVLEQCAALDDRVRLFRQPINGGTYLARNLALDSARGEYITNQDSDDWSHPRRIEQQLAPMLADRRVRGTRGTSLRCDELLRFSLPGWDPRWPAVSTLMFRRQDTLDRLGYWDCVRKSADSEFLERLRLDAARADEVVLDVEHPLLFARLVDSGLSRSELMFGWKHEARRDYWTMLQHWHRALEADGGSAYLAASPPARPFPAPSRFRIGVPGRPEPRMNYDVVIAGDWCSDPSSIELVAQQVRALAARQARVGLVPLGNFSHPLREGPPTAESVLALVAAGSADWVNLDQGARADVLVVQSPTVLVCPPSTPVNLVADRVFVLAEHAPDPTVSAGQYTVEAADGAAQDLFGARPSWVPRSAATKAALGRVLAQERVFDAGVPSNLGLESWSTVQSPARRWWSRRRIERPD